MDPRYDNESVLNRRTIEWNYDSILENIRKIFKQVEIVPGWKLTQCQWMDVVKSSTEELKRTISRPLKIEIRKIEPKTEVISEETTDDNKEKETEEEVAKKKEKNCLKFILQIPILINEQFFYIGGFYKIPIFQLIDNPVIWRETQILLRTNILSATISGMHVQIFGKTIHLPLIIAICHTKKEVMKLLKDHNIDSGDDYVKEILEKCDEYWAMEEEERLIWLGCHFSDKKRVQLKKGQSIVFSLKLAKELDYFCSQFFLTDSIPLEMFLASYKATKSNLADISLDNKRIRFSEYLYADVIKTVYNMILEIQSHTNTDVRFKINPNIIINTCSAPKNESAIVHFLFPINPVGELASLYQITVTGPGSFKKNGVPAYLRNIDESHQGRICPADTPDRENCGVVLNSVPTLSLNDNGTFGKPSDISCSYTISLVPFMKNDDQTRLQMSSSQQKKAILLKNSEKPWVKSGIEDNYLDRGTFLYKAKRDGVISYLDSKYMICSYNDRTAEVIPVGFRQLYSDTVDMLEPQFSAGEIFKEGDIICQSLFLKDGELSLGQNLLTGIAIWKGFNYEDGIVISDAIVTDNKFTSFHGEVYDFMIEPGQILLTLSEDDYEPLPKVGQLFKKGEPYARLKVINGEEGLESINLEPIELTANTDCIVSNIEIFPNSWNGKIDEFNYAIRNKMIKQTDDFIQLYEQLKETTGQEYADKFVHENGLSYLDCGMNKQHGKSGGKYVIQGKKIGGVCVRIQTIYTESIGIGDKIANRHGNKGVIAKIIPKDMMPRLKDGRVLDIIINPLGIISRMNVGQLFELAIGEAIYQLRQKMKTLGVREGEKLLKSFLKIVDKTPKNWASKKILSEWKSKKITTDEIYTIQPPFHSLSPQDVQKAMELTGAQYKYDLLDPETGKMLENPIAVGYIYFLKLFHRASASMSARSIGPYSKKTLQPLGGKARQGGHRLGEMEVWSLLGHGAGDLLETLLTAHSDSPGRKNKLLADILQNPMLIDETQDNKPQSLRLLDARLRVLGLEMYMDEDEELKPNSLGILGGLK